MEKIQLQTSNKKQYLDLLLLADPDERMLDKYLEAGKLFVLFVDHQAVCVAVILKIADDACELKNLATLPARQNQGYARAMLNYIFAYCQDKYRMVVVGTAQPAISFYEKFGFAYSHTVSNFFIDNYLEPIWEEGVQLKDMIYLKKLL